MTERVHDLLTEAARLRPSGVAVIAGDAELTYGALDALSNQAARVLADLGVTAGDRVALYLDKSVEAVAGIYAVLKAGGGYVPLDPAAPLSRLSYIVSDCDVRVVITSGANLQQARKLSALSGGVDRLLVMDDSPPSAGFGPLALGAEQLAAASERPLPVTGSREDLAYILYTSGSTGRPKGVMVSHGSCLHFVEWAARETALSSQDRLSSHAPFHFDLSTFDLFAAARAGACVIMVPPECSVLPPQLTQFIRELQISVWYSVPSILTALVQRGGIAPAGFPDLRTVIFAGEVFPTPFLRQLMALLPSTRFTNWYGPTETNVCTHFPVPQLPPDDDRPIPIGRTIDGTRAFVLDENGSRCPPGVTGEMLISGPTLMSGYWGDPDKTARSLSHLPDDDGTEIIAYRTGDLVILDGEGEFRFRGRRDHQIKSRGYRIELGEIEAALIAHPGVRECAVVAVPDPHITNTIRACVVAEDGLTRRELLRHCRTRLPSYMLPTDLHFMAELPKTSTGKTDRQALATRAPHQPEGTASDVH